LDAAGITGGPLFRPVAKGQCVQAARLTEAAAKTESGE
jgi:hypothetical protein